MHTEATKLETSMEKKTIATIIATDLIITLISLKNGLCHKENMTAAHNDETLTLESFSRRSLC